MCGGKKSQSSSSQSVSNQDNRVAASSGSVAASAGSTAYQYNYNYEYALDADVAEAAIDGAFGLAGGAIDDAFGFADNVRGDLRVANENVVKASSDALQFVKDFERNRAEEDLSETERNADRLTQFAVIAVIAFAFTRIAA